MAGKKGAGRNKDYYKRQFLVTRRNKIRRLKKRLGFDPTAGESIKRLQAMGI